MRSRAVNKYLSGEFSQAEEDEFAEHFFVCEECANDLRRAASFLDMSRIRSVDEPRKTFWRLKYGLRQLRTALLKFWDVRPIL